LLSPRLSPRIAGTPEEKEESSDDAVILERLSKGSVSKDQSPIISFLTECS
jgi:hypothetical protein